MLRNLVCFLTLLFASRASQAATPADNLVDFTSNGTFTAAQSDARIKKLFRAGTLAPAKGSIDLYKIRYRSKSDLGAPIILTGLVALPHDGAVKGLVLYCHGTTGDRAMSPSRFKTSTQVNEAQWPVLAFASGGYGVVLPDYQGLGDNPGAHPYPMWKANSVGAVDILLPARILAEKKKVAVGPGLYISGYSEGGAVAMWTTRTLEAQSVPITAAAPLSGPYDLSGETRKALLLPAKNITEFAAQLYLLSYTARYFAMNQGAKLTDYLQPNMASQVAGVFEGSLSDEDIIKRLVVTSFLMGANNKMDKIMAPRFVKAVQNFDTKDPMLRELKNNDCYDWTPRTKMLLVALDHDAIVTDANTRTTLKAMRARGVTADTVRDYYIHDASLNHLTAPGTAVALARKFFDGGFGAVSGK